MIYTYDQIKRKLENTLRVFRTQENDFVIDTMIKETLENFDTSIV